MLAEVNAQVDGRLRWLLGFGSEPNLRDALNAGSLHHSLEPIGRGECLRFLRRSKIMPNGYIVGIVDRAIDAVAADTHRLTLGIEIIVDLTPCCVVADVVAHEQDRKSTRLNSSHLGI